MRRYMQLAYLFHQYAKSLLSTDGRTADCTVRHPGVERPFSSLTVYFSPPLSKYFFDKFIKENFLNKIVLLSVGVYSENHCVV